MRHILRRSLTAVCAGALALTLSACSNPEDKLLNDMDSVVTSMEKYVSKNPSACSSVALKEMERLSGKFEGIAENAEVKGVDPDTFNPEQYERLSEIMQRMMALAMSSSQSFDHSC